MNMEIALILAHIMAVLLPNMSNDDEMTVNDKILMLSTISKFNKKFYLNPIELYYIETCFFLSGVLD